MSYRPTGFDEVPQSNPDFMPISPAANEDLVAAAETKSLKQNGSTDQLVDHLKTRKDLPHGITDLQAMMNLIKGLVGTGVLSLPQAFFNAGLWTAVVLTIVIGIINVHCMHIIVDCSHKFCKMLGRSSLDYADVAEVSLLNGPERFRKLAKTGRYVVNIFLFVTQLGFCCVYFVFISNNIKQVIDVYTPASNHWSVAAYMAMVLPFILLLCSIRHLKFLAPFSLLANLLYVVGLIITFQFLVVNMVPTASLPAFNSWARLPLFFGTVMFAFEGVCLVLPIENRMVRPKAFSGLLGVMNTGTVLVVCLYMAVGFYGYVRFGADVIKQPSITLNLPDEPLYQSVKIMLAVAVFFTYAVQFYVPFDLVAQFIHGRIGGEQPRKALLYEYLAKFGLILVTFCMAELIPHLDLFISLVGSLSSAALAMIFPPLIELLTLDRRAGRLRFHLSVAKNVFIVAFGTLGFTTGTYSAVKAIVDVKST